MVLTNISQNTIPSATNSNNSNGESTVSIPIYANWFEFGKIHEMEQRALPEFFTSPQETPSSCFPSSGGVSGGEKTPSRYMEYRDFMINTYRLRPKDYLTVTTCRRHLTGDVGSLVRIHNFLEQWGLINYQAEIPAAPLAGVKRPLPVDRVDIPQGLQTIVSGVVEKGNVRSTLDLKRALPKDVRIVCSQCQVDCSRLYYVQNSMLIEGQNDGVVLCALCYAEGRFPSPLSSVDFIKIDVTALEASIKRPWSDEETLALLTAVEKHEDDWDAIAQAVSRPKDQCLFHFLKLPSVDGLNGAYISDGILDRVSATTIPFAATENPILSTLAFLASSVHPKVAAAAAQAAIEESLKLKEAETIAVKPDPMDIDSGATESPKEQVSGQATEARDKIKMEQVAATSIACAAVRSRQFADQESNRGNRLRDLLVDLTLQKLRLKMNLLEELERSLETDKKDLEQQRLQLFFDRFNLKKQMIAIEQKSRSLSSADNEGGDSAAAGDPGPVTGIVNGEAVKDGKEDILFVGTSYGETEILDTSQAQPKHSPVMTTPLTENSPPEEKLGGKNFFQI